ncbi:MAG: C25 family cysteine peptidase, partial [Pyrinomonadaceae bacterium]
WYRVTSAQLAAAGLGFNVDPTRLQLFAGGIEQAIRVNSDAWEKDGTLEFYGEALDTPASDARVYWLIEGATAGRRIGVGGDTTRTPAAPAPATTAVEEGDGTTTTATGGPTSFAYTVERRERLIYFSSLLNGETENFFGRVVGATPVAQALTVHNSEASGAGRLEVALQGVTASAHNVRVLFNGTEIGTLDFAGREHRAALFDLPAGAIQEGDNEVRLVSGASGDVSLTDYLRLSYNHTYRADEDALRVPAATGGDTIRIAGFTTPNVRVFDVTDSRNVSELPAQVDSVKENRVESYNATVRLSGNTPRTLYAFADTRVEAIANAVANEPTDWNRSRAADFVIITNGAFREAVAPLAARREKEGLSTAVVDVEDLYDEFSYGVHSPQAVKDFLAWTTTHWTKAPRYVLLVGDGSYDPRDRTGRGSFDLVPAKLVDTTQMETASDNWYADFNDDGMAEMSIGRLPVRTIEEATRVVGKIVAHEPDAAAPSSAVMVADRDGADGYSFEAATDSVQNLLPATVSIARINRGPQSADAVRNQIVGAVNAGPSIVNWMGHGSINVWTGEGLLRGEDASALQNGGRLPLFVMMTCLNGYYQDPSLDSLSESLLKAEAGGALAVWTSTGMTEPEGQAAMNRELYRALFGGEGGTLRLGDAMLRARSATNDTDVLRTWVLIGDPTTRWR